MSDSPPTAVVPGADLITNMNSTGPEGSDAERTFFFVPGYGAPKKIYRGKIRAHVLQQYLAQRRSQSRKKKGRQETSRLSILTPADHSNLPEKESAGRSEENLRLAKASTIPSLYLSSARTDPFASLPHNSTRREKLLTDFYIGDLINSFGVSSNTRLHPPRDVCFIIVSREPSCWNAMLSYSSRHLALRQASPDYAESRRYRGISIAEIQRRLQDPATGTRSDATMVCLLGLLAYNIEFLNNDNAEDLIELNLQLDGLHNLIRNNGGFPEFSGRTWISWLLCWFDFWSLGRLSWDTTPLSSHAFMSPSRLSIMDADSPQRSPVSMSEAERGLMVAEEFTGIYGSMYKAAYDRHIRSQLGIDTANVGALFEDSSLFSRYILSPMSAEGARAKIMALVYINVLLYDYRDSLSNFVSGFMRRFPHTTTCPSALVACKSPVGPFLWPMITEPGTQRLESPKRLSVACRALSVYTRLSIKMQQKTEDALEHFLRAEKSNPQEFTVAPELYRTLVMGDLVYKA